MALLDKMKKNATIFCDHCEWVCRCWSMNLAIFDCLNLEMQSALVREKLKRGEFKQTPKERLLHDHLLMSGSYTLLETAKLHDPAADPQGNENLSIAFFVERTYWTNKEWKRIKPLKKSLNRFCSEQKITTWRNKYFAHHDRKTFEEGPIHTIPRCEIDDYLETLGKLTAKVWKKWELETENDSRNFDWSPSGQMRLSHPKEAKEAVACILVGHKARNQ